MIPVARTPSARRPGAASEARTSVAPDFRALREKCDRTAVRRELALLGLGHDDPSLLLGEIFRPIAVRYARMMHAFPRDRRLLLAMVRRLEIDNVRLAWGAVGAGIDEAKWTRWWRPLGEVASVDVGELGQAGTLGGLAKALEHTPYGDVARAALRGWSGDMEDSDALFEVWAWRQLRDEVARGTQGDPLLREILMSMIRERDVDLLRRRGDESLAALGRLMVVLNEEIGVEALSGLAGWNGRNSLIGEHVPAAIVVNTREISDWEDLLARMSDERRMACLRAKFLRGRDLVAAMASLVLDEEDVGRLAAAVDSCAVDELGSLMRGRDPAEAVPVARGGV